MESEKLLRYLDSLPDSVKKNLTVVAPENDKVRVYHLSTDPNLKKLIPRVPSRRMITENDQIPRACTSNSILGAIIGYQATLGDFMDHDPKEFNGGWYIYELEAECCVKPKRMLVDDGVRSGECWLVPYSKDTWEWKARRVGKLFYESVTLENDYKYNHRVGSVTALVELEGETPHKWSKAISLDPGYHELVLKIPTPESQWNQHRHYSNKMISEAEYAQRKKQSVDLLSRTEDNTPQVGDYLNVDNDLLIDPGPCMYEVVERKGDDYWTTNNPTGEDPYTIPAECFTDATVDKSGKRICTAEPVDASNESLVRLAPSHQW